MRKLLLGLIGAGIQRSLAPALQEEEARYHGIRMHYQLIDLDGSSRGIEVLPQLIESARIMGFAGLNITYPCKQSVVPLLDELSEEACAIGAVNTVVCEGGRLVGHNTDGSGWSWGFRRALPEADLSSVVLLGAGGAGGAAAPPPSPRPRKTKNPDQCRDVFVSMCCGGGIRTPDLLVMHTTTTFVASVRSLGSGLYLHHF